MCLFVLSRVTPTSLLTDRQMIWIDNKMPLYIFIEVDFFVMVLTLVPSVLLGLEIGILIGIAVNLMALLYFSARPSVQTKIEQVQ